MSKSNVGVGVGVIIINENGQVLIVKRSGKHAPKYSIPGGMVEPGESFEAASNRETLEEIGIKLIDPNVIAVTNNLDTYREESVHNVSIILVADTFEGEPKIMEPDKFDGIGWYDPGKVPEPHFDTSRLALQCYMKHSFYEGARQ